MPQNLNVADSNTEAAIEATKEKTSGLADESPSAALANKRLSTIAGHLRTVNLNETKQASVAPAPTASTLVAAASGALQGAYVGGLLSFASYAYHNSVPRTPDTTSSGNALIVAGAVFGGAIAARQAHLKEIARNTEDKIRDEADEAFIKKHTPEEQEQLRAFQEILLTQREYTRNRCL